MPFIIMQHVQPASIIIRMQSQHAPIMAAAALSPLVQVMATPMSVISILHVPIIMLHWQHVIPFIIMANEHIPPCVIMHRLWSMAADALSSHAQVIRIPPSIFSNVMRQRGVIIPIMPGAIMAGIPAMPVPIDMPGIMPAPIVDIPGIIIPRSVVIMFIGIPCPASGPLMF